MQMACKCHAYSNQEIKKKLSSIPDEDLETLYESIKNIKTILNKLDESK
ncbi:hypothetical protein [Methanobacterium sp. SMA-27]|nr:hypothetical protein [Methanobacterium sp. SMA-27]